MAYFLFREFSFNLLKYQFLSKEKKQKDDLFGSDPVYAIHYVIKILTHIETKKKETQSLFLRFFKDK